MSSLRSNGALVAIPLEILWRAALWVQTAPRTELKAHGHEQAVARGGCDAQGV